MTIGMTLPQVRVVAQAQVAVQVLVAQARAALVQVALVQVALVQVALVQVAVHPDNLARQRLSFPILLGRAVLQKVYRCQVTEIW